MPDPGIYKMRDSASSLTFVCCFLVLDCMEQLFRFDIHPPGDLLVLVQVLNHLEQIVKGAARNESTCTRISASWAYSSAIALTRASSCSMAQREKARARSLCSYNCISI